MGHGCHERRKSGRVDASGTAVVHGPVAARGRILDLSIGGISVAIQRDAWLPPVGARVRVDICLDGRGRWLHVAGCLARIDPRRSATVLAIELLVVPRDFEDLVQDELLSALEYSHQPQVVLVDAARGRRELVADLLRSIGGHVLEVSTALEAIVVVDQTRLHLSSVVIAETEVASRAEELGEFLRDMYPRVPVVVVGERDQTGSLA